MRISDWSSDVCSSDLHLLRCDLLLRDGRGTEMACQVLGRDAGANLNGTDLIPALLEQYRGQRIALDRKSVVSGKSVSVRVDLGCRRIIKKKNSVTTHRKPTQTLSKLQNYK